MAAPAPEPPSGGLLAELTPFERTFVLKQRSMEVISGFLFPFQGSAWLQSYLDLCGGDTGRMAIHYGYSKIGEQPLHGRGPPRPPAPSPQPHPDPQPRFHRGVPACVGAVI